MSLLLPFTLAAIMTTDPLGYECVPEDKLEVAFSLGGKGMRVAQTCIPDPCAQTFSETVLATYSGYRDDALYRDYRSRMTETCGTPTVWQDKGIPEEQLLWAVFDGGSGEIPLPDLSRVGAPGTMSSLYETLVEQTRGLTDIGGGLGGGSDGGLDGDGSVSSVAVPQPEGKRPAIQPPEEETPAPVPLPAPFLLLLAAAFALVLPGRMRRGRHASRGGRA